MYSNSSYNRSLTESPDNTVNDSLLSDEFAIYTTTVCMAFTEVFSLFGCFSNIVNMIVFARQGFKDSINVSLFGLSMSDFGVCFLLIWENISLHPVVVEIDDLPFYPGEVGYVLFSWTHIVFVKITTILTALIVFERCLCVVMPIKIKTLVTTRRVKIVMILTSFLVMASFVPSYYANQLDWKFNPQENRSVFGLVFAHNRHEIDSIVFSFQSIFLSVIPFIFISSCTAILYYTLKRKAAWRQSAATVSLTKDILTKDAKVARMVVLVSTLFIVCLFPYVILITLMTIDEEMSMTGRRYNLLISLGSSVLIPEAFSSSMNVFIYYRNSSRYQTTFKKLFGIEK